MHLVEIPSRSCNFVDIGLKLLLNLRSAWVLFHIGESLCHQIEVGADVGNNDGIGLLQSLAATGQQTRYAGLSSG